MYFCIMVRVHCILVLIFSFFATRLMVSFLGNIIATPGQNKLIFFFLSFFFSFLRIDFFIPGVATVGGFSICSSPRELKDTSTIELAVKHSNHPPALWVHTKVCVYTLCWILGKLVNASCIRMLYVV